VRAIVGARGESVKGFIVLRICEKRLIVAAKIFDEKRVTLYHHLLNQLELYLI